MARRSERRGSCSAPLRRFRGARRRRSGCSQGSRSPKASLPTLSPANVPTTEAAIARYERIAAAGGWPQVPQAERLRTGARNPAVLALRQRLTLSGDLDSAAVENDIYDSYVEAAVKRFQARHGIWQTAGRAR